MKHLYLPEGSRLDQAENLSHCASMDALLRAISTREILEGMVLSCSPEHDLTVQVGPFLGVIPRKEAALGVAQGSTREIAILSRVGKPVSFVVTAIELTDSGEPRPILSRCQAQALALGHMLSTLRPGDILPAVVTHLEPFGAFVDIGCGVPSMIGIENISVSRLPHPKERFRVGQSILAVVTALDRQKGRVNLSHKELLGSWQENTSLFTAGMTVPGVIRSKKSYGLFVELTPNLSGLADPKEGYEEGERVSVFIKSILPHQMKLKLLLIDHLPPEPVPPTLNYFISSGHLEHWRYAPENCLKSGGETDFSS